MGRNQRTHFRKPRKKCHVTRKAIYPNEKSADKGKIWIWSHDPHADITDLHSYKCEHCNGWHIGHRSYYEKSKENKETQFAQRVGTTNV